ncbi:hypothetical protein [Sediminispirochaeta smaragdinae]|uniref:Uncharacterized protein n=1 Tax=Sediminispirochaeta smaragdinae (strain DSM 11293 / JCM 15392 / SEBR 4228) TaxID=573413 RepID=E1R3V3_SEDSS|nr:hypothetical protein [Sediminispirochaeta smaragdinae]ADK82074.1 conserved hypothetical protein [Sediminispirochaeta smaragdinae DSM 11293]
MNSYIYLLIALAFATSMGYLHGRKRNKQLSVMIGEVCERLLKPKDTTYVNIGGVLGHNFTYQLEEPFSQAKGTFTLLPRHSLLYLPFSFLITRYDRFYLHIFTTRQLKGEAHIIAKRYFPKMRVDIAGIETLKREEFEIEGRQFILLWDNPKLEPMMKALLESSEGIEDLLHFCCYRDNNNFFIHAVPKEQSLAGLLAGIYNVLPSMMKERQ